MLVFVLTVAEVAVVAGFSGGVRWFGTYVRYFEQAVAEVAI